MRALYAGAKYYVLHRGNTQKDFEVESKVYLHLVAYTFLLFIDGVSYVALAGEA